MILSYNNRKTAEEILENTPNRILKHIAGIRASKNKLIYGDNLGALKSLLADHRLKGRIDLIYIDPPFATNGNFKIGDDRANTISQSNGDDIAYNDTLVGPEFMEFLRTFNSFERINVR